MADIASLGLYIDSSGVVKATKELKRLHGQSGKNETANKSLGASFSGLGTIVTALASSFAIKKFLETAGSFESMAVSLETVTGSAEKATMAMAGITQFAKNTPFQVSEITQAFIKLKALGIQPTESALTSFGNTSSAMGKSLNQMIEAVADAATGEFERLKEFGIKAKSEGDNVTFTFQGVATTVGKNSKEISAFLESIGKTQFAGAMSKQMDTINGKISNLGDAFDNLIVTYSNLGAGEGAKGALDFIIDGVNAITDGVNALPNVFTSIFAAFDKLGENISYITERGIMAADELFTFTASGHAENKAALDALNAEHEREIALIDRTAEAIFKKNEIDTAPKATGGIDEAGAVVIDPQVAADRVAAVAQAEYEMQVEADAFKLLNAQMFEDEKTRIAKQGEDDRRALQMAGLSAASGIFSGLTALMATAGKKQSAMQKVFARASIIASTAQAVMNALATPPYPLGLALAAGAAIKGAAQLKSVGGGGGSIGGSTIPATPATTTGLVEGPSMAAQAVPKVQELRVTVEGDTPNSEAMRVFVMNLEETISNMGGVSKLVLS